jgi:hypothetical protein
MSFINAMTSPDITKVGVNGSCVYTENGVGNLCISLFTMLNRGLSESYIVDHINKIIKLNDNNTIRDLFVMAFQTRDIRGGKGEKDLFYYFISALYKYYPQIIKKMIKLIPEYGCWRDMWILMRDIPELEDTILSYTRDIFSADKAKSEGGHHKELSLLAKWLPREGSGTYPGVARKIANYIYSDINSSRKRIVEYRKQVSTLNKVLKTVEINMCGKDWKNIDPEVVPGRNLKIHNKAYLNEKYIRGRLSINKRSILRYPNSEDRMKCRENFLEFIKNVEKGVATAHGANVVMPHEIVRQSLNNNLTDDDHKINQCQWDDIRRDTLEKGGLGKCVPMCDFSGSMSGLPKLISLALGILISEINHSSFRDHILTFDVEPKWHSFTGKKTLYDKLQSIKSDLGQGLNTDFYKACMKILDKMKEHKVPIGEEPDDLIVLTDMGWDDARQTYKNYSDKRKNVWQTQIQLIRNEFKRASEEVWGIGVEGWKIPRIVIWNLQPKFNDFHAKAEDDGVVMISGWSPNILKTLQKGNIQVTTPYQGLREILDDERYNEVRNIFDEHINS